MWDISPGNMGSDGSFATDVADFEEYYDFFEGGGIHPGHPINPHRGTLRAADGTPWRLRAVPRRILGRRT